VKKRRAVGLGDDVQAASPAVRGTAAMTARRRGPAPVAGTLPLLLGEIIYAWIKVTQEARFARAGMWTGLAPGPRLGSW
jgi:hypothetical protein